MRAVIFDLGGTLVDTREGSYDHVLGAAPLHNNVEEVLPLLYRLGVKMAVVTDDASLLASLDRVNMRNYFYTVVTPQHVASPDPTESILLALRHLEIQPHEAILVGDTATDIIAGKAAGMAKTVAVTHGLGNLEDLQAAGATHLVSNIPSVVDVLE